MAEERSGFAEAAQRAADRLAVALEAAGFDVGKAFPSLRSGWDGSGAPGVQLGSVTCAVALDLATLLISAVDAGVTFPSR